MSPNKKQKLSADEKEHHSSDEETTLPLDSLAPPAPASQPEEPPTTTPQPDTTSESSLAARQARFAALKSRASKSATQNLKAAAAESARLATDPSQLTALQRKQAIASHNLLKAETEASGEDFERKRAWDWTVEESEKWDKRMEKKGRHRNNVAFQDHTQEANKVYKRNLRDVKPDIEAYEKQKAELVARAARSGGLEIVETEDGEVIAIDKHNRFYSDGQNTDFVDNKPDKEGVDRLVKDLQKAEETRLRKRRERGREDTEEDITFINEKNKQFNQKLARFYNKVSHDLKSSSLEGRMLIFG